VSGGVGTLILYLLDEWAGRKDMPPIRVIDTRGAGGIGGGLTCFAKAFLVVFWLGVTGRLALVHAHMTTRGSVARKCLLCALAAAFGRPTIIHMHGADFFPFYRGLRPVYQRLIGGVLRRARYVVVLGESWRRFLTETVGIGRERVAIVMNGVPRPAAPPAPRPAGGGPVRLLFLGRLGERKGVPELIAALATPDLRARDWVATIAGDGDVPRYREAVARTGLADRMSVPGWVDRERTRDLLSAADILVLPSRHEAMPIAVIEAMAYRVAVVTTPVGVIPEILRDGESALLVPPGDPGDLARALSSLIDDPTLRRRLADAGNEVFMDKLDVSAVAERVADLYRTAIDGDSVAPPGADGRARRWAAATAPSAEAPRRDGGMDQAPASPDNVRNLLDRIEPVRDSADAASLLARLNAARETIVVSFVNQHAFNVAWRDPCFARQLREADVLLRDGVGIGICMRLLGLEPGLNMNGTDFIPVLAAAFAGRRVALYGTRHPWLAAAAAVFRAAGCDLVEILDGFQPDETYVAAARASRPDLLIMAMGIPKQERVANLIAARVAAPMLIVNGGAIADFLGGRFPRAPRWLRRIGLEWAFRLCREPTRLWRRYVTGGILFIARVTRLRLTGAQPDASVATNQGIGPGGNPAGSSRR
jgi:exopolysaccharide biosynthesis WecB/TagA/CpsF family protein